MNPEQPKGKESVDRSQYAAKDALNERLGWLQKDREASLRLLVIAASENGFTDAIDFLYSTEGRRITAAKLLGVPEKVFYQGGFVSEDDFIAQVQAYRKDHPIV